MRYLFFILIVITPYIIACIYSKEARAIILTISGVVLWVLLIFYILYKDEECEYNKKTENIEEIPPEEKSIKYAISFQSYSAGGEGQGWMKGVYKSKKKALWYLKKRFGKVLLFTHKSETYESRGDWYEPIERNKKERVRFYFCIRPE